MSRPALILFGTNAVSYNAAVAVNLASGEPYAVFPRRLFNPFRYSRYFSKSKISSFKFSDKRFCDDLIQFLKKLGSPKNSIIPVCCSDDAVDFLLNHYESLSQYLDIKDHVVLKTIKNKNLFFKKLKDLNFAHIPQSYASATEIDIFPIVAKPSVAKSVKGFVREHGGKIKVLTDKNELATFASKTNVEIIYQEYISFREGEEWSWCGCRDTNGNITSVSVRHIQRFPNQFGRVVKSEISDNSTVKSIGDKLVSEINYVGIADIQMLYDGEKYRVIEMNPRLWCGHELLLQNGLNLIAKLTATDITSDLLSNKAPPLAWTSSLYTLLHPTALFANTEHFLLSKDNLVTKIRVRIHLTAKVIFYSFYYIYWMCRYGTVNRRR